MKKLGGILIGESMASPSDIYDTTLEWCSAISRSSSPEESVTQFRSRLQNATDFSEVKALKEELVFLLESLGNFLEAKQLISELIELEPTSVIAQLKLVSHYLYAQNNPEMALKSIWAAEILANESGHFRRHVAATKARIALALERYDILDESLVEISKINLRIGQRDVRKERDFFDRADKSRLKRETVKIFEYYIDSK